ncbi:hypothetical protein HPP92_004620, partial [Vanilla planifolia]
NAVRLRRNPKEASDLTSIQELLRDIDFNVHSVLSILNLAVDSFEELGARHRLESGNPLPNSDETFEHGKVLNEGGHEAFLRSEGFFRGYNEALGLENKIKRSSFIKALGLKERKEIMGCMEKNEGDRLG